MMSLVELFLSIQKRVRKGYVSQNDFLATDWKSRIASVQESIIHSDSRRVILYVI